MTKKSRKKRRTNRQLPEISPIPDTYGGYGIDRHGIVYRLKPGPGVKGPLPRALEPHTNLDGYNTVQCSMDGLRETFRIDILMMNIFGPERPQGQVLVHRDGDNQNDALDNLRYKNKLSLQDKPTKFQRHVIRALIRYKSHEFTSEYISQLLKVRLDSVRRLRKLIDSKRDANRRGGQKRRRTE